MEIIYKKQEDLIIPFKKLEAGDLFRRCSDESENPTILIKTKELRSGAEIKANAVALHTGSFNVIAEGIAVIPVKHELIVEV